MWWLAIERVAYSRSRHGTRQISHNYTFLASDLPNSSRLRHPFSDVNAVDCAIRDCQLFVVPVAVSTPFRRG